MLSEDGSAGVVQGAPSTRVRRGQERGTARRQDGDGGERGISPVEGGRMQGMVGVGSRAGQERRLALVVRGLHRSLGTSLSLFPTLSSSYSTGMDTVVLVS